jgi:hypothetical protein
LQKLQIDRPDAIAPPPSAVVLKRRVVANVRHNAHMGCLNLAHFFAKGMNAPVSRAIHEGNASFGAAMDYFVSIASRGVIPTPPEINTDGRPFAV